MFLVLNGQTAAGLQAARDGICRLYLTWGLEDVRALETHTKSSETT